jgi:hypothetical protein
LRLYSSRLLSLRNVLFYDPPYCVGFFYLFYRFNCKKRRLLIAPSQLFFDYNPMVILSVLKLYILTLPLMPYFCFIRPSAVLISLTPLVPGNIAHDVLFSLFMRNTP